MADDLPHISSPPLAPCLPGEEPQPAAPRTATTASDAGEIGPLIVVPLVLLESLVSVADGFQALAETSAGAMEIRANGFDPDMAIQVAQISRQLASRAIGGEWGLPSAAISEAIRRAETICLARARRERGHHIRVVPRAAVADAPTAEGLRAIARNMMKLADAAVDPAQAEAMRVAGLRPDLMAHLKASAACVAADAEHLARVLATARNDTPPAA